MNLHKILKYIMIVMSVIAVIFLLMILTGNTGIIPTFLTFGYIILAVAIFFTLLFSITNMLSKKETLKKTLISFGIFALIVIIAYATASGEPVVKRGVEVVSESGAKWIDAGLKIFYILGLVAIATVVFSGFKKMTK